MQKTLEKQMVFRKKYIKILGWGKRAQNDQKVNILAFCGVSGGFRKVNPPQSFPFFKNIYFFVLANIYASILIPKF